MNRGRKRKPKITFRKFHSAQDEIYRNLTGRDVLRCGRRFGKTTMLEDIAGNEARKGWRVGWFSPSYKLLMPSYKRILHTIRPVVSHHSKVDALIETAKEGQVEFWTLENEDAGRSRFYDLVIIDEGSLVKKGLRQTWETAIRPTLLDRRGRAIMAGTPKGVDPENFFYEACTDPALGFKEHFAPTRLNPMLDADGVAKLADEYPPLVYQQEFLAEFVDWSGAAFFELGRLLENGAGIEVPDRCDAVFAVIDCAAKDGKEHDGTGVIYCARSKHAGHPLVVLDYDLQQVEGALLDAWLPTVLQNLESWAVRCKARMGSLGVFIEDQSAGIVLLQQARRRQLRATAIDSKLTSLGKDARALSVSGYHYRGEVKITDEAYNKVVNFKGTTRNHLISQVTGFRMGDKDAAKRADDLLDCYAYSIMISLGDNQGY